MAKHKIPPDHILLSNGKSVWKDPNKGAKVSADSVDSVDSLTAALLYNSLLELVCWLGPGSAESLGAKCETKGEALKNANIAIQHYQVEKVDITT